MCASAYLFILEICFHVENIEESTHLLRIRVALAISISPGIPRGQRVSGKKGEGKTISDKGDDDDDEKEEEEEEQSEKSNQKISSSIYLNDMLPQTIE